MTVDPPASGRRRLSSLDALWLTTAAAAATPLLVNLPQSGGLATWERVTAGSLLVFAAWRPLEALFLLVGVGPLARATMRAAGSDALPLAWMLPAVLLGGAVALAVRRHSPARWPTPLVAAAIVLAWMAMTSVAVTVLAGSMLFESPDTWRASAWSFLGRDFFAGTSRWRATTAGVWLAQEVLLVPLAATVITSREDRRALSRIAIAAATGVAALNISGGIALGVHRGGWFRLLHVLRAGRFSQAFPDVNAAGSFLALAVVLSGALCVSSLRQGRHRQATIAGVAFVLQLAGLWLTGSRVALAAAVVAAVGLQVLSAWRKGVTAQRIAGVGAVLVLGVIVLGASQARRLTNDAPLAWTVRVEFVKTTWRMLQDHPLWGVGVGAYLQSSPHYSSRALRAIYPVENAHNNFLQIAGELGPVALGAFVLLALAPLVSVARATGSDGADDVAVALWGGWLAFLLTCAGGHPLLIPEVGVFALSCLGALASANAPRLQESPVPARTSWMLAGIVAALLVSVPLRATAERRAADLEHVVVTGERWTREDGIPTLRFRGDVAVYVVADGGRSNVTLRVPDAGRRPAELTLRLDDQIADIVRISDPDWKTWAMVVPPRGGERFRLLRIEARAGGGDRRPLVVLRRIDHDEPGGPPPTP